MKTKIVYLALVLVLIFSMAAVIVPKSPFTGVAVAQSFTVTVPSTQPWTDTGLTVSPGDVISITASGSASWDSSGVQVGPNGRYDASQGSCGFVVMDPTVPAQSLIGNIAPSWTLDGKGFFVGSSFTGTVPIPNTTSQAGKLFLGFNDGAVYCDRTGYGGWGFGGDNHGSFTAIITITSAPTPTPTPPSLFDLVNGISQVTSLGVPGPVQAEAPEWVPIVAGNDNIACAGDTSGPKTFVMARSYGAGRVVIMGHDGLMENLHLLDNEKFVLNIISWLDSNNGKKVMFSSGHSEWLTSADLNPLRAELISRGYSFEAAVAPITDSFLTGRDVLIFGNAWGTISAAEIAAVETFVANGGGLFLIGLGWSWEPYHPGTTIEDYPMMKLAAPYDVRWLKCSLWDVYNDQPPIFDVFYPNIVTTPILLDWSVENYYIKFPLDTLSGVIEYFFNSITNPIIGQEPKYLHGQLNAYIGNSEYVDKVEFKVNGVLIGDNTVELEPGMWATGIDVYRLPEPEILDLIYTVAAIEFGLGPVPSRIQCFSVQFEEVIVTDVFGEVHHFTLSQSGKSLPFELPTICDALELWATLPGGFGQFWGLIVRSPVDLHVEDPDGLIINKDYSETTNAIYLEKDIDDDGDNEGLILLNGLKDGEYVITVTPKPGAEPTDTYSLEVLGGTENITLAQDIPLSDIPNVPYGLYVTENGINAAPIADAGPDQTVERSSYDGAEITLNGTGSYDPDDGPQPLAYEWTWPGGLASGVTPTAVMPMGTTTVTLNVSDGGLHSIDTVDITVDDTTLPEFDILFPLPGQTLQDTVTLTASASDLSGLYGISFAIREPGGPFGVPIGFENLEADLVLGTPEDCIWEYSFNTLELDDGYYEIFAFAIDNYGWVAEDVIPVSIRNWAVVELLPATHTNKAGRTMPVKFSLRVAEAVDPAQPFVYNEELEIRIYDGAGNLAQVSTYGDTAGDYRIDIEGEKYITNFKTDKKPADYTVEIWRSSKNFMIDSFTFETVK